MRTEVGEEGVIQAQERDKRERVRKEHEMDKPIKIITRGNSHVLGEQR